ncbi:MAG: hypothetical protein IKL00_08800 [Oscillospiraceae bacterium]|nr:hypothetical protein [Oscillospiraceae bacterium]
MRLIDLDELLKREEQAYRQVITQEAKTPDAPIVMTLIHEAFVEMLADSPIVEAEPVIHAHWIPKYVSNGMTDLFECSNCSARARVEFMSDRCYFKWCHNCGAKMDGKEE